jgi:hypothetical protein
VAPGQALHDGRQDPALLEMARANSRIGDILLLDNQIAADVDDAMVQGLSPVADKSGRWSI